MITRGSESREGESPMRMWCELTEREKREANERGFPRGGDIRYFERKGYRDSDGGLCLTRFTRLPSPGRP